MKNELSFITDLSKIALGERVVIVEFDEDQFPLKLLEMGILPGNEIAVKHIAPLNDPIHVEVAGYDLALRRNEAEQIPVKRMDPKTEG